MNWFIVVAMTNAMGLTNLIPVDGGEADFAKCVLTARVMEQKIAKDVKQPQGASVRVFCVDKATHAKLSK